MFKDPGNIRLRNNAVFYKEVLSDSEMNGAAVLSPPQNTRPRDDYRATEEFVTYERLCRGEETVVRVLYMFCILLLVRDTNFLT